LREGNPRGLPFFVSVSHEESPEVNCSIFLKIDEGAARARLRGENAGAMGGWQFLKKSERQTCQCRRRGYFKEYIQPAAAGYQGSRASGRCFQKKDELFCAGYCICKK